MKKLSRRVDWVWLIVVISLWSITCAQADQRKAVSSGSEIDTSRLEEFMRELERCREEDKRRDELWKKDPKEYMRRYVFPKLVPVDDEFLSKLPRIKERIAAEAAKMAKERGPDKGPESVEEAWELLRRKKRSFAWRPTRCLEHEGVYYFSGGNSAGPVYDFSWGYAIRKGDPMIYEWRLPEFKHPLGGEEDWDGSGYRHVMATIPEKEQEKRFDPPKIVSVDGDFLSKLPRIKEHLTISRVMRGVQSWEEASWLLNRVSMACPPRKCVEYEGVFYFSGGTSTVPIDDFSSGFAIPKGDWEIYEWDLRESNNKGDGEGSRK